MTAQDPLKPCPFCGSEAYLFSSDSVGCAGKTENWPCPLMRYLFRVKDWNTRPTPPASVEALSAEVEALKKQNHIIAEMRIQDCEDATKAEARVKELEAEVAHLADMGSQAEVSLNRRIRELEAEAARLRELEKGLVEALMEAQGNYTGFFGSARPPTGPT